MTFCDLSSYSRSHDEFFERTHFCRIAQLPPGKTSPFSLDLADNEAVHPAHKLHLTFSARY